MPLSLAVNSAPLLATINLPSPERVISLPKVKVPLVKVNFFSTGAFLSSTKSPEANLIANVPPSTVVMVPAFKSPLTMLRVKAEEDDFLFTVIAPPLTSNTAASTTAPVVSAPVVVIRLPFLIRDNVV